MSDDRTVYLDYNATTPVLPEVVDAMLPYLRSHFGNPSSGHRIGRRARRGVDTARRQVANLLGASPSEIIFTSGGTEANNLAIQGVTRARGERKKVVSSVIEHAATRRPCQYLGEQGWDVHFLEVDGDGRVAIEQAQEAIDEKTALLTVMHSNNETGVIQPISELISIARDAGVTVHTDAAQSVGKVPIDVGQLDVDLLSLAGHKVYAPKGVGALYVKKGTPLSPVYLGGGHERGLRPGTENVAAIVGLGAACEVIRERLDTEAARVESLRDLLWESLDSAIDGVAINGHCRWRLPNTLNIRFPGVAADALLAAAPTVAASTGSACHSGRSASKILLAMGVDPEQALGSVRLSLGGCTTESEVKRASQALIQAWKNQV